MFGVSSPTSPTLSPENPKSFDFGQFVSRQFNFLYIAGSLAWLTFVPWPELALGAWARMLWVVVALLCNVVIVQVIKLMCYLPRPNTPNSFCWGRRPHSGFPSGHTVPAFLLATLVAVFHPFWGVFWYGAATLIAWARWRTEAHFAYQVVLSALMGVGLALALVVYLKL